MGPKSHIKEPFRYRQVSIECTVRYTTRIRLKYWSSRLSIETDSDIPGNSAGTTNTCSVSYPRKHYNAVSEAALKLYCQKSTVIENAINPFFPTRWLQKDLVSEKIWCQSQVPELANIFERFHLQSFMTIQPIDVQPDGTPNAKTRKHTIASEAKFKSRGNRRFNCLFCHVTTNATRHCSV